MGSGHTLANQWRMVERAVLETSLAVRPPARIFGKILANSVFESIPENVENPNRCINTD